jgi:hypothetical protein
MFRFSGAWSFRPSCIFPKYHVKTPVQLVFSRPMPPDIPVTLLRAHFPVTDIIPVRAGRFPLYRSLTPILNDRLLVFPYFLPA